jgi:hypothetical protein
MLRFLVAVASFSDKNMMTPTNLGIVFSPNVLQSPEDADVFRQFEVFKFAMVTVFSQYHPS